MREKREWEASDIWEATKMEKVFGFKVDKAASMPGRRKGFEALVAFSKGMKGGRGNAW